MGRRTGHHTLALKSIRHPGAGIGRELPLSFGVSKKLNGGGSKKFLVSEGYEESSESVSHGIEYPSHPPRHHRHTACLGLQCNLRKTLACRREEEDGRRFEVFGYVRYLTNPIHVWVTSEEM